MNWLDVLILLPFLAFITKGVIRGFVSEIIAFVVVIFGALLARLVAPPISGGLQLAFAWPAGVCDVGAYVIIFIGVAIGLAILAKVLNLALKAVHLGWVNRLFGGLIGALKAFIVVVIVVFILDRTNDEFHYLDNAPVVQESVLYPIMVDVTDGVLSFSRQQSGQS